MLVELLFAEVSLSVVCVIEGVFASFGMACGDSSTLVGVSFAVPWIMGLAFSWNVGLVFSWILLLAFS